MDEEKTTLRLNRIEQRVLVLRDRRTNRMILSLITSCLFLCVCLTWFYIKVSSGIPTQLAADDLNVGTMLLDDAGGYVLIGVIAFTLGVVFTLTCLHLRRKHKVIK